MNRNVRGEKSDEDVDGDEEDRYEDEDAEDEDAEDEDAEDEDAGDEEKDISVVRIGPPKGRSGSGHVKSHQDAVEATFPSSVDGNIFIFVTVIFF